MQSFEAFWASVLSTMTVFATIFSDYREFPHLIALSQEINATRELEERNLDFLALFKAIQPVPLKQPSGT